MTDIITGLKGKIEYSDDLSGDWNETIDLGKAKAGQNFAINGELGGIDGLENWDSADRLLFRTSRSIRFELTTDPRVITELVRFDNGVASVVGSVEYGNKLSLNLTPGRYGLSFFVEGDVITYQASASFL
jgi:hypothetical protein